MKENNNFLEKLSTSFFLIFLGTLFLLNNFGYLEFTDLFKLLITYWPVLIILAGLKIILNVLPFGKLLKLILDLMIYVAIGVFLITNKGEFKATWFTKTVEFDQSQTDFNYVLKPEEPVSLIDYSFTTGASKIDIADSETENVLSITGKYFGEEPMIKTVLPGVANEKSSFAFNYSPMSVGLGWNFKPSFFDVNLSQAPVDTFSLSLGAGEGNLDLKNLDMKTFILTVGAGDLESRFGSANSTPENLTVKVGAGNVDLYIPKDVKIILKYNIGAGMISLYDQSSKKEFGGLAETGTFTTSGNSDNVVNIAATVGAGNINIYHE